MRHDERGYNVVATLREGRIVSTITSRVFAGKARYSYAIRKEYETEEGLRQTKWMELGSIDDTITVLEKTRDWIEKALEERKTEER